MEKDFLTWGDTFRILNTFPKSFPIYNVSSTSLLEFKSQINMYKALVTKIATDRLSKLDIPKDLLDAVEYNLCIRKNEDGSVSLALDPCIYLASLTQYLSISNGPVIKSVQDRMVPLSDLYYDSLGDYTDFNKQMKRCFIDLRNFYLNVANSDSVFIKKPNGNAFENKTQLYEVSDLVLWCVRNTAKVVEVFNEPLTKEEVDELTSFISKDKIMGYMAFIALGSSGVFDTQNEKEIDSEFLDYINTYKYFVEKRKADGEYDLAWRSNTGDRVDKLDVTMLRDLIEKGFNHYGITSDDLTVKSQEEFEEKMIPDYISNKEAYEEHERQVQYELEQERIRKEEEEARLARIDAFKKEIQLTWEILPASEGNGDIKGLVSRRESRTDSELRELDEIKERMLQDKIEAIGNSNYLTVLKGINKFEGYSAYVYPNGKVILEIFYKSSRKGSAPVYGQAAYAMNLDTFIDVSHYGKTDLRELRKSGEYPDIEPINHTKNYKNRINKILSHMEYDETTLSYIEDCINNLRKGIENV